ncbi:MAG: DUF6695 family protein [Bacteroidota bacterium]|jgi:hypothetical protein
MANMPRNTAVLVLAWPEVTARAEEGIMKFFRSIGVVKNVNVMVGHAAMMVADGRELRYYDFGRYITPRRMGRIRSGETDPALVFTTVPEWSDGGELVNLEAICRELDAKSAYTHGEGLLQLSVYSTPDVALVDAKARELQHGGLIGYHGLDPNQTNCARFVQTALLAGIGHEPAHYRRYRRPITYTAPTPFFNVLAAAQDGSRYLEWRNGHAVWKQAPLIAAWWDVTAKIFASASRKKTAHLNQDGVVGKLDEPAQRPELVPAHARYLGGIGEGAWYTHDPAADTLIHSGRWSYAGSLDYEAHFVAEEALVRQLSDGEARLAHDSHYAWLTIEQSNGTMHRAYRKKQ